MDGVITHLVLPRVSLQKCTLTTGAVQYLEMMASRTGGTFSGVQYEVDHHADNYASASGSSGYGAGAECCPLVVDLLCLAAILASIGGASVLLARVIQIEINAPRRRKRRSLPFRIFFLEGKLKMSQLSSYSVVDD